MRTVLGVILFCCSWLTFAGESTLYRDYWMPMFQGHALAYCLADQTTCGQVVADHYCRLMGYQASSRFKIAYHAGLTQALVSHALCQGWTCDSFERIRCRGEQNPQRVPAYAYRSKVFMWPRWNHDRIAWCDTAHKHCGREVAKAWCRRMGYMKTTHVEKESHVLATRTLDAQKLCFGPWCEGFKRIVCYR